MLRTGGSSGECLSHSRSAFKLMINPGNFRKPVPPTLTRVATEVARCSSRGDFREALFAGMAGMANVGNHYFHRRSQPRYCCSCCGETAYAFGHLSNRLRIAWNSACPVCDSRSRHRGLALLIPKIVNETGANRRVLHFAPEHVLRSVLLKMPNLEYRTTDLFVKEVDYPGENIEALSFPADSFDIITYCNHVLEHVKNDEAAIGELARILRPGGIAVITIPRRVEPGQDRHISDHGIERSLSGSTGWILKPVLSAILGPWSRLTCMLWTGPRMDFHMA